MSAGRYEVVVVGAGAAGLSAAVGLARAGVAVAVLEAAPTPGAETRSGGVYFAATLAHPDLLGPAGVETLAWERRLVERGVFVTDGHGLLGLTYRDPDAFRHCYTVRRPVFDAHLARVAEGFGATLLAGTTALSLIRDGGRAIGVSTDRGPVYGDLVFLAEGDVAHLVEREGYQHAADPRDAPTFSLGLTQTIDLPPGAVEERFGLGATEGAAYDLLLRNATSHGRPVYLNLRGLVSTDRQGLTLGLIVPLAHLTGDFAGNPSLLLEWFLDLPVLRPWLREGRRGPFAAKVLRGGGARDVPQLVADGLAVGGAAAGLGVPFPFLNATGPATVSGYLLARAVRALRAAGGDFTHDHLRRHYVEPLRQTPFWQDMAFLRRWPGYVRTTRVLFDRGADLALGSAYAWARPGRGSLTRWAGWLEFLGERARPRHWPGMYTEVRRLQRSLHWRAVVRRPALDRLLLDGTLNTLRDLLRRPRVNLPAAGTVRLHYSLAGAGAGRLGPLLRRWFRRFTGVLAPVLRRVWGQDDMPLSRKLPDAGRLLFEQVNLLDLLAAGAIVLVAGVASVPLAGWRALRRLAGLGRADPYPYRPHDLGAVPPAGTPDGTAAGPDRAPLIRVLWPRGLPEEPAAVRARLGSVCPAAVFEVQAAAGNRPRVLVHADRCVRCEACWRAGGLVDWGRLGRTAGRPPAPGGPRTETAVLLDRLEGKLAEFDAALAEGPATVDRGRADHLEMLARYARQLALRVQEVLRAGPAAGSHPLMHLAAELVARTEERARRAWDQHFAWAAADGRQLRQHHLPGLRRLLEGVEKPPPVGADPTDTWLRAVHGDADPFAPAAGRADELCSRAVRAALTRVRFPGRFRDADGRDAIAKFGVVKQLLAEMAVRRYLIETLSQLPVERTRPVKALVADALDDLARTAGRVLALAGVAPDDPAGVDVRFRPHEEPDDPYRLPLPDEDRLGQQIVQRQALHAELEELRGLQARLDELTRQVHTAGPQPAPAAAELAEALARQEAAVLAGRVLLLRTHALLERGPDAQVETALLRVWLEDAAAGLDEAAVVRRRLAPAAWPVRPVVEPGSAPPPSTLAGYLASPCPYRPGDFLTAPADLLQPRLVPELTGVSAAAMTRGRSRRILAALREVHDESARGRALLPPGGVVPGRVAWRLAGMDEDVFIADALAYEAVGLLEHPGVPAVRLEANVCRLLLGELRRRVASAGAAIRGQAGPALPGDEGRQFLRRVFILKELVGTVVPRWAGQERAGGPRHLGREILEVEALKGEYRRSLEEGWRLLGVGVWQNPDVQPSCFLLAEAAAWLKAADGVLARLAWWGRRSQADEDPGPVPALALARRALDRCTEEVRCRLRRFDADLAGLRRGYHAPGVRAAALLLRRVPPGVG